MVNVKVFKIRTYHTNGDVWETKRYSKDGLDEVISSIMQTEGTERFTVEEGTEWQVNPLMNPHMLQKFRRAARAARLSSGEDRAIVRVSGSTAIEIRDIGVSGIQIMVLVQAAITVLVMVQDEKSAEFRRNPARKLIFRKIKSPMFSVG